jgi:hypothetical protein
LSRTRGSELRRSWRFALSDRVQQPISLLLEILDDGAEVNRLVREPPILRDFRLIHHFEPVPLKQLGTPSTVEGHHLGVDLFDAMIVEMAQVSLKELSGRLDGFCRRKKVDVKMPDRPRRTWYFTPSF